MREIEEHVIGDAGNRFHCTSVSERMRSTQGMTLSLYLEVQKIWEELQRSRVSGKEAREKYLELREELKALLEEHT